MRSPRQLTLWPASSRDQMTREAQSESRSGLRCTAPGMCPDGVEVRDAIGGMEFLVAIRTLHEQGPDAPCLLIFVVSDAVEQLNRRTVVEDLASDLQMGSGCGLWVCCRPDHRGLHSNGLSWFAARESAVLVPRRRCALAHTHTRTSVLDIVGCRRRHWQSPTLMTIPRHEPKILG